MGSLLLYSKVKNDILDIPKVNQVSLGNKNIRSFETKIWNCLPPHIKSYENQETFKRVIKSRDSITCNW